MYAFFRNAKLSVNYICKNKIWRRLPINREAIWREQRDIRTCSDLFCTFFFLSIYSTDNISHQIVYLHMNHVVNLCPFRYCITKIKNNVILFNKFYVSFIKGIHIIEFQQNNTLLKHMGLQMGIDKEYKIPDDSYFIFLSCTMNYWLGFSWNNHDIVEFQSSIVMTY